MTQGDEADKQERIIRRLAEQLGVSKEKLREQFLMGNPFDGLAIDSMDLVELVIELEDELEEDCK